MSDADSPEGASELFFLVSLNDDAARLSAPLWQERFSVEHIRRFHLDLRGHAPGGTQVSSEELRAARREAVVFLREQELTSTTKSMDVVLRCKLTLAMWLGYEMRFSRRVRAFKYYSGAFTPFSQREQIEYTARSERRILGLSPEIPAVSGPMSRDAILLVDLIGRATDAQLERFCPSEGAPAIMTRVAHRLTLPPGTFIRPQDLEPILTDVIETIGVLRNRGAERLHLGFAGPDVVAFFLGQQLRAQGVAIHLYEFHSEDGGAYQFAFPLEMREHAGPPRLTERGRHFLDETPFPFGRPEARQLLDLLRDHISRRHDVEHVLKDAGVSTTEILLEQASGPLWRDALEKASAQGKLRALLTLVVENPEYALLAQKLKRLMAEDP